MANRSYRRKTNFVSNATFLLLYVGLWFAAHADTAMTIIHREVTAHAKRANRARFGGATEE
jgi:hypothetical protein